MITILCIQENSNYKKIPGLDLWDIKRNAYNYNGNNIVIAHPPCQQWSKLKSFAKENQLEKDLAIFCLEKVNQNGGILEHPNGSSFFKYAGIPRSKLTKVYQSWWGFPAKKETLLYCKNIKLLPTPLNLDAIQYKVANLDKKKRSLMPLEFCKYLVYSCII